VKHLGGAAGLENEHFHQERHTFVSQLIEDGMDAILPCR
jgi:site-specific recombinase XerD